MRGKGVKRRMFTVIVATLIFVVILRRYGAFSKADALVSAMNFAGCVVVGIVVAFIIGVFVPKTVVESYAGSLVSIQTEKPGLLSSGGYSLSYQSEDGVKVEVRGSIINTWITADSDEPYVTVTKKYTAWPNTWLYVIFPEGMVQNYTLYAERISVVNGCISVK